MAPKTVHSAGVVSLASNPVNRLSVLLFLTAIARAFRCPINTTSFLPRVMPV
jgi:hypothetical protein